MSKKLMLGCDPEVFLGDADRNVIIPACGLIGGTKDEPKDIGQGVKVQEDNVTVEFNIEPVAHEPGASSLARATELAFNRVTDYVQSIDKRYYLHVASSYRFPPEQLASEAAQRFGCDPDLNAYMMGDMNPTFTADEVGNVRMAGGHVHLGLPEGIDIPKWALVQLLDGLVVFRWQNTVSNEVIGVTRGHFYGKPGAYRDKPYGLEYRTPSNYWLTHSGLIDDITDLTWWIINNPAATKNIYDMINFRQIQDYHEGKLNGDSIQNLITRMTDIFFDIPLPEKQEKARAAQAQPRMRVQIGRTVPNRVDPLGGIQRFHFPLNQAQLDAMNVNPANAVQGLGNG